MPNKSLESGRTAITNFRFSPDVLAKLDAVVESWGAGTRTAVIKMLIQQAYLKLPPVTVPKPAKRGK